MLPSDGSKASEDLAFDLIANANALAGQLHPIVTESVGDLGPLDELLLLKSHRRARHASSRYRSGAP